MKKRSTIALIALWGILAFFAWVSPSKDISEAERRPLAGFPKASAQTILTGKFQEDFEDYALDQFPFRDGFRRLKAGFQYGVLRQKDNNGIYLANGYAVKQEYPLNQSSVTHFLEKMNYLHEKYLTGCSTAMAIVPDKGYYLAKDAGQLYLNYDALKTQIAQGLSWADQIDLTDSLSAQDYYRTDTHWRQENLIPAAGKIAQTLGVTEPKIEDYTVATLNRPFYGVYYGQAALPMEPEAVKLLESDLLSQCTVYDYETGETISVYDREKGETARDPYDVYLSGSKSLLTIENPNAKGDRELIVFRDSFGSSMAPLLVGDYAKVTLIDVRYIRIDLLDRFVEFTDQDVLLLYSTLVLNQSLSIQ